MKHLFFVNSHMTFLTAKQSIKYLKLNHQDCCFVLERNYPIEEIDIKSIVFPYNDFPNDFRANQFFLNLWKKIRSLDVFLEKITEGDSFEIFYPHSAVTYFYLIITHPKCVHYSLIEGGIGCYYESYKKRVSKQPSVLKDVLYRFLYRGRVPNQKFFFNTKLPKFRYCVGTNEYAFKNYDNQLNVGSPFEYLSKYQHIKNVFVFCATVEFYDVKMDTISEILRQLFEQLKAKKQKILHFKLHPEQLKQKSVRDSYLKLINQHKGEIEVVELKKTDVLEHIAASSNATFYVIFSSVGLYASILGREVWSFGKVLSHYEPQVSTTYKKIGKKEIQYFDSV